MYYTSEQHKNTYNALVNKYNAGNNNEYKALLYLLTTSDDIRRHLADCIEDLGTSSIFVKEDALHHGWATGADKRLIRLAFNLYNNGVPTAIGLEGEDLECELTACTPVRVFSGLDERNFKAAITGLHIWANRI